MHQIRFLVSVRFSGRSFVRLLDGVWHLRHVNIEKFKHITSY